MIDPARKAKLTWRCRRGMLELDLILLHFAQSHLDKMTEKQIDAFESLLHCTDPELLSWLMEHEKPKDKELSDIVQFITMQNRPSSPI